MSSVSSNYNMPLLQAGIAMATISLLCAIASALGAPKEQASQGSPASLSVWLSLVAVLYSVMMFGSSYIEEEQHFWYWIGNGWMAWLYLTRFVSSMIGAKEPNLKLNKIQ